METLLGIAGAIGVLLVLIVVHEAGHFFVARFFGMQTPLVGLGLPFFGEGMHVGTWRDVEFRLHPVLLGAYVAIPELEDESDLSELRETPKKFPAWQRLLVSLAGPGANVLFALFLAIVMASVVGVPKPIEGEFYLVRFAPTAPEVAKEKLSPGDRLLAVNGQLTQTTRDFQEAVESKPNERVSVSVQRDGTCRTVEVPTDDRGHIGIMLSSASTYVPAQGVPIWAQIKAGWDYFVSWALLCVGGLFYLLSSPFRPEGGAKLEDVHGIVVATNFMAEFIRQDVMEGLRWGGIFSLELALFNLLPILPLDGGHVAFQIGEMVTGGRQLPRLKQGVASLGLAMILTLMVIVIFNDLRYLFAPDQL